MPSGLLCAMCRRMVQEERVQDRPGSRGAQRGCPRWLQWGSTDGCRHTCMHAWPARGCTAAQQRLGLAARSCCHSTPQRVVPSHPPPNTGVRPTETCRRGSATAAAAAVATKAGGAQASGPGHSPRRGWFGTTWQHFSCTCRACVCCARVARCRCERQGGGRRACVRARVVCVWFEVACAADPVRPACVRDRVPNQIQKKQNVWLDM